MKGFAQTITRDSFPLPSVDGLLADARHELEYGRGFLLLRGVPIERYTDEEAGLLYRCDQIPRVFPQFLNRQPFLR